MGRTLPQHVDTVIVGNGPSALILSYILHGNIPVYDIAHPHPDSLLDHKLRRINDLLAADVESLTAHFSASRFCYSTQALPVNVLFDTLIRPHGETDDSEDYTCLRWEYQSDKAVDHVVVGDPEQAGGQWVDNPVEASWDIETLSYAGMLSLPGYSFSDHHRATRGTSLPPFQRPSRREVAEYLAEYPKQVGIEDTVYCSYKLEGISRTKHGFYIESHGISCRHVVLATGTFSHLIPPRHLLQPLVSITRPALSSPSAPLLVIGSGFSAADVIISTPPDRKIIHIYRWAPSTSPSPLQACHQQAYPEYAGVYRLMKFAATAKIRNETTSRPKLRRGSSSMLSLGRNWERTYEGLPNTSVVDVKLDGDIATITCQSGDDRPFKRQIGGLAYVVGRRGSLTFLDAELQAEVCREPEDAKLVSLHTLRQKALSTMEVADNIFIIGSLTGDSLVRFAYGSCAFAAGRIISRQGRGRTKSSAVADSCCTETSSLQRGRFARSSSSSSSSSPSRVAGAVILNGLDGHNTSTADTLPTCNQGNFL